MKTPLEDGSTAVLGPNLRLLSFAGKESDLGRLEIRKRVELVDAGFVIDAAANRHEVLEPLPFKRWTQKKAFVVAIDAPNEGHALAAVLHRIDRNVSWSSVASVDEIDRDARGPLVVFGPHELANPNLILGDALARHSIVWMGETEDGAHVGPLFREASDVDRYRETTATWRSKKDLFPEGCDARWPLSIMRRIRRDPERIARAVLSLFDSPKDSCKLLDRNAHVCLATATRDRKFSPEVLAATQNWARGICSGQT
ncbi:MAG: hypothetical protein ACREJX_02005 [Polyangiaceae bacterium]